MCKNFTTIEFRAENGTLGAMPQTVGVRRITILRTSGLLPALHLQMMHQLFLLKDERTIPVSDHRL